MMKIKRILKIALLTIYELIKIFGISFLIVFILTKFLIFPCQIDGSSMYPTLENKDLGCSIILSKTMGVNRFDIVVIDKGDKLLVKRVIGLPNDTIEYIDNVLYVNGQETDEPYLVDVTTDDFKVELGEDEYYCLGDNRNVSLDSRYYGSFHLDQFKATHAFIFYPFENFGYKS